MKKRAVLMTLFLFIASGFLHAQEAEQNDVAPITTFPPAIFQSKYKSGFILVDASKTANYKSAHLQGAIGIDFSGSNVSGKLTEINRDVNVFVYASEKQLSLKAAQMMANMGFRYVYNLDGTSADLELLGMPMVKQK